MRSLRIRVREAWGDRNLAHGDGPRPGELRVEVPPDPIKDDRGTVVFPWPAEGESRLIVKVYGEMGRLNWLRKQVVGYRACREFRTLARLRAAGIACCEPAFWGTGRSAGRGLYEVVATRELPGARTLAECAPHLTPARRAELLGRLFEQLAAMHQAGVFYGVAFLTNVILTGGDATTDALWIIDLEKSIYFARDIRGSDMAFFDLNSLTCSTFTVMGRGYARTALARYGLGEPDIERVLQRARDHRSSKFGRYRRRAAYLARGVVSRLWHGV